MHMDVLAARRTQAGVPTVHGMNCLLWAIDVFAAHYPNSIREVSASFRRFVALEEEITLEARRVRDTIRLLIRTSATRLVTIKLSIGDTRSREDYLAAPFRPQGEPPFDRSIVEHNLDTVGNAAGVVPIGTGGGLYPDAERCLGRAPVAAIMTLSFIVGMRAPGLHSIFSDLRLAFDNAAAPADTVRYKVSSVDDVFRMATLSVEGAGICGTIEAFVRIPPVTQPTSASLRTLVAQGEYAGVSALVVGGSRGLGELTAKLLALGGANVCISYATGAEDAARVATEIRADGGSCETVRIDVREQRADIADDMPFGFDQIYYFASGKIFSQRSDVYTPGAHRDFMEIYVDGFYALCRAIACHTNGPLTIFYPSSVAVDERPAGMTEYAMAKVAAELLCYDIAKSNMGIDVVVRRLPRLLTDQTATVTPMDTPVATPVMIEVVTAMMARRR